jgi:hypothetical protein
MKTNKSGVPKWRCIVKDTKNEDIKCRCKNEDAKIKKNQM